MTYTEALEQIERLPRFGQAAGLERMRTLMHRLGDPQRGMQVIHIAGSNGKGSTATLCESVLRRAGYHTGLFVSPYIYDFRERIQLDGQLVERALLAQAYTDIAPVVAAMAAEGTPCVQFEVITALALTIFRRTGCQLVVLEVGIGGLLDSTNLIDPPLVAAITSLSLEHTALLGHTLPEIAAQKCGIIKPGCQVAAYCSLPPEGQRVLEETCRSLGIRPEIAHVDRLAVHRADSTGAAFAYEGREYVLTLAGEHQIYNALTALMIFRGLERQGIRIPEEAVGDGLRRASIPGRLQLLPGQPRILLDGAHNPEKIRSLCAFLDSNFSGVPMVSVMGMLDSKDYAACVPQIARRSTAFVATQPGDPRAVPAEALAALARDGGSFAVAEPDPAAAAKQALALAEKTGLVLICGSMYLLAEAKEGLCPKSDKI